MSTASTGEKKSADGGVPIWRLYLLRAVYLLIAVGLGSMIWPLIIHHDKPWDLVKGEEMSLLGALSALCLLGLHYPLQMLPLLLFEITWKLIWLILIAVPLALAYKIDADTMDNVFACLMVVIVIIVVPWDYVFDNYVKKAGDRWW